MQRGRRSIDKIEAITILIASAAILAFAYMLVTSFFYGPGIISWFDSPIYAQFASIIANHGYKSLASSGPLGTVYLFLTEIALFYKMLGANAYSSAMSDFLLLAVSFVGIYKIGSLLDGKISGIISGIVYVLIPFNIIDTASMGVNIPLEFATIFTVMFFIMGYKEKRRAALYYALSGLFLMLNVITMIAGVIIFLVVLPFFAYILVKSMRKALLGVILPFAVGIAMGLWIIALFGVISGGAPFSVFAVNIQWYGNVTAGGHSNPGISLFVNYLQTMFPYPGAVGRVNSLPQLISTLHYYQIDNYAPGFTFYFTLAFGLYLLAKRKRNALLPTLWIVLPLLYLSFGTVSLKSYMGISFIQRLVSIMFPGAALIIGIGIANLLLGKPHRKSRNNRSIDMVVFKRYAGVFIALLVLVLLVLQCFYISKFVLYSEYNYFYQVIAFGNKVNSLQGITQIFSNVPADLLMPYVGYDRVYTNINNVTNCSQIPSKDSAMILCGYTPTSIIRQCGLTPMNIEEPGWLSSYVAFNDVLVLPLGSSKSGPICYGYIGS